MAGTNGRSNGTSTELKGLPPELIKALMGKGRARGVYGPRLKQFAESDEAAINPRESWPLEFEGKTALAMTQSFRKHIADADLEDVIQVVSHDGECYLVHKERAAIATQD